VSSYKIRFEWKYLTVKYFEGYQDQVASIIIINWYITLAHKFWAFGSVEWYRTIWNYILRKVIIYFDSAWNSLSPCVFKSWLPFIC
jgi:hypothetical protein